MTETDKARARDWLRKNVTMQFCGTAAFSVQYDDFQKTVDAWLDDLAHPGIQGSAAIGLLAAYGAAQYEAGAASARKRAKAKVVGHHRFSHDGPCPKNCYYETAD